MALIKVSDYIAQKLADAGISDVFMVTGGGAMHLNDSFGKHSMLRYITCHHEQACAIAADSYFRLSNRMAAVSVTTGPGGTNAITGVYGAWVDSLAMVVVSGQVKWETTVRSSRLPLRQLGDQEVDIVRLVEPITKYAVMIEDAQTIRYHLERALHLATEGRPGPVWLDVPMNIQGTRIDPDTLPGYDPSEDGKSLGIDLNLACQEIIGRLQASERPVIYAGSGIRLSGAYEDFLCLVDRLGVPVVTAWNSHDLIWDDHHCYAGRPGGFGDRAGNFVVQNADFLLSLGCRLSIRQVSYNWESFARDAYKVVVDIDPAELNKPTIKPDLPIHADVADVIREMLRLDYTPPSGLANWRHWCRERRSRFPVVLQEYREKTSPINPYVFVETLFEQLEENEIVVAGDGTACVVTFQAAKIKKGQRLYHNSGSAPMGYDLPAAVGAAIAAPGRRIVCLAGDGSIQMNLQELQTIAHYRLPIKIFLLNNGGYHSIRQTQNAYFGGHLVGCEAGSGVTFPDFGKLASAYGISYRSCNDLTLLEQVIADTIGDDGPQMCEVILDVMQEFAPKLASRALPDGSIVSPPLEDMYPFLSPEQLADNMWPQPR